MADKITYEQFFQALDADNQLFVQDLHKYLLDNGCKVTFEDKKSGYMASYKLGKPPRAFLNLLLRKNGLKSRIYGENIGGYPDFLNTLPPEMVQHIEKAGACGRLVDNTCSPKCTGYDFIIGEAHFQKCRYNCFEFLMTKISRPFIKTFLDNELTQRQK